MKYKYTKEKLQSTVYESISVSDVMRKLDIRLNGGNHKHISKSIKKFDIDTKHFLGKKSAKGKCFAKKHWSHYLVKSKKDVRTSAYLLRRALIESGRNYSCVKCNLKEIWNNKKITLEVHHKNGNWLDNNPENLEFLCPNCHSQEANYKSACKENKKCIDCFCCISKNAKRCKSCAAKLRPKKIDWPSKQKLEEMLKNESYCSIAKKLKVSDNAIRKRLKRMPE